MGQQAGHATRLAELHIIVNRMVVTAGTLECQEHRFGHGPARQHEAFREPKVFEPALPRHHAMLGGVKTGHTAPDACIAEISSAP